MTKTETLTSKHIFPSHLLKEDALFKTKETKNGINENDGTVQNKQLNKTKQNIITIYTLNHFALRSSDITNLLVM